MAQLSQLDRRQHVGTLFPLKGEFRIVELKERDARGSSDHLRTLRDLIVSSQPMYPGIVRWFKEKVIPGLRSAERVAYVAYEDEKPIASAILKLGKSSKFCHVRVHENFQDLDLGQIFFTLMTLQIRHHANQVHFTLPESLWYQRMSFFESFGFSCATKAPRQYRHGDVELACSAPQSVVWSAVMDKLPNLVKKFSVGGFSFDNKVLMSFRPKYADAVLSGKKLVEIRRKFSKKWVGCKTALYASHPVCSLVGEARVSSVTCGSPRDIWMHFGASVGCSYEEFDAYAAGADRIFAIELSEVAPYLDRIPLVQISQILDQDLRPPQSYCELGAKKNDTWAKAVSIASLLHGHKKHLFRHSSVSSVLE